MSIEPWNNGEGAPLCRESLLIYLHGISYFIRKGYHPFPASGEDGFGQSPIMGQGTGPLRVLRAEP